MVLNNDIEADPDFLERLVAPLASSTRLGMTAPLLLRPGREKVDGAGLVADATLAAWPRLQGRPASEAGESDGVLAGPSGAAGAFRREALEAAGGFDERIFLYGEDLDVVLRIRAAGWDTALVREAVAVHVGGATTGPAVGVAAAPVRLRPRLPAAALGRAAQPARAARTLALETAVAVGDLVVSRDLAALRGRVAGWRVGARAAAARAARGGAGPDGLARERAPPARRLRRRGGQLIDQVDHTLAWRHRSRRAPRRARS